MKNAIVGLLGALSLAACASTPDTPPGPPSLEVSGNIAAPDRARFYADCIAQSAAQRDYFRESRNNELLRFNCEGDVAMRFFDGLGPYAADVGSELVVENRTWRFTNPIQRDLVGLDYCWRDQLPNNEERFECTVVLNVGPYLARGED